MDFLDYGSKKPGFPLRSFSMVHIHRKYKLAPCRPQAVEKRLFNGLL